MRSGFQVIKASLRSGLLKWLFVNFFHSIPKPFLLSSRGEDNHKSSLWEEQATRIKP